MTSQDDVNAGFDKVFGKPAEATPEFKKGVLPTSGQIWTHNRKGSRYRILRLCRFRNYAGHTHADGSGADSKWTIGVAYAQENPIDLYVREYQDFMKNFTRIE